MAALIARAFAVETAQITKCFLADMKWTVFTHLSGLVPSDFEPFVKLKPASGSIPWPPLVTGLISDIFDNSAVGET